MLPEIFRFLTRRKHTSKREGNKGKRQSKRKHPESTRGAGEGRSFTRTSAGERHTMFALRGQGLGVHSIAKRSGRSTRTVHQVLTYYGTAPMPERGAGAADGELQDRRAGGKRNRRRRRRRSSGEAPPQSDLQSDRMAERKEELKLDLMELGYLHLQEHPEVFNELALGVLCNEIGVQVPEMPSFDEEIVHEAMRDPDYRAEEAKRIMKSRRVEAERIAESLEKDYLFAYLKRVNSMARMMGFERNAKPSAGAGLGALAKILLADGGFRDLLEVFKNVRPSRTPAQGPQASRGGETPRPEGRHRAGKEADGGGQWSGPNEQVAQVRAPSLEPQSPAPQEPRANENPSSGTGPRRFDIGVPADSLGLLGLRGDTSFVDWPLV